MTSRGLVASVLALGTSVASPGFQDQQRTFRARTDLVAVDVSVRNGNLPVPGLMASDFQLLDNGVLQKIEALSMEAVPLDVTLFHDTSPSLGGRIDELKDDVREIATLLRPMDRLRLLTFDLQINDVFGWQAAGGALKLETVGIGRISSVYDAIFTALMHRPDADRRHLIVALTDCIDTGSVVGSATIEQAARRAEGVLHIVKTQSLMAVQRHVPGSWIASLPDAAGERRLEDAARLTGGRVHAPFLSFRNDEVRTFNYVFDDFRQSYLLRYTPRGVPPGGWHEITVKVPANSRYTIRARKGYFGG